MSVPMHALPDVAPFAGPLAELAVALRTGQSCLVTADKGWALPLWLGLRDRLRAAEVPWVYLDGRPDPGHETPPDVGAMLLTLTQLRAAVRTGPEGCVVALPHLDVMAAEAGGWTTVSRELIPLLYENPAVAVLGFRDPTLPLLPVVDKLFHRRWTVDRPYRTAEPP